MCPHKGTPHEVHNRHAVLAVDASAGSPVGVIHGPYERRVAVEDWIDFAVLPDVVAGGDDIHARAEQVFGRLRSQTSSARGVLAVGDYEVNPPFAAYFWQQTL